MDEAEATHTSVKGVLCLIENLDYRVETRPYFASCR